MSQSSFEIPNAETSKAGHEHSDQSKPDCREEKQEANQGSKAGLERLEEDT